MKSHRKAEIWLAAILAAFGLANVRYATAHSNQNKNKAAGPDEISELIDPVRVRHGLPGLAAAVVWRGEIAAIGHSGVRKAGDPTPVGPDDLWHIGSCGKSMTATLMARLADAGTLGLDATVGGTLPDLADAINPAFTGVTVRDLLANHSGIPSEESYPGVWFGLNMNRDLPPPEQRRTLVRTMLSAPAGPRDAFRYSNINFALAGHMAETRTGTAWEELMQSEVFEPLGITTAGQGVPWEGPEVTQPWPHVAGSVPVPPGPDSDNPPGIAPAGTMHLSMNDWARYIAAHLAGARGERDHGGDLLSPETWATLHTPVGEPEAPGMAGYGGGWSITTRPWAVGEPAQEGPPPTGRVLTHSGSNTMWYAVAWLAPERDFAVLAATNIGGQQAALGTDAAAAALIGWIDGRVTERAIPDDAGKTPAD